MLSVYKMELIKMMKRKNSLLLLIPCLLSILMALGYKSGILTLSDASGTFTALSCLDFTMFIWSFLLTLGIMSIIVLLIGAFQFAGEVENGQIKIFLLRTRKREHILMGKALALLTFIIAFIAIFWVTTIAAYYIFINGSDFSTGTFALSNSGYETVDLLLSILGTVASYFMLVVITFCLGTRFSMFLSFIVSLIIMYAGKFMAGTESMKFMRVTPFFIENLSLTDAGTGWIIACIAGSIIIIGGVFFAGITIFKKTDIK